tara:strand:- start:1951 stop:2112 length:162 start_codon:yes stop_codon:yes gene_type:complete
MNDFSLSGHALYKEEWYYIISSTLDTLTLWDEEKDAEFHVTADDVENVEYEYE